MSCADTTLHVVVLQFFGLVDLYSPLGFLP